MTISNVTFNGTAANAQTIHDQIARYLNGTAGLSSASGLILATGQAIVAEGPNDQGSATLPTLTPFTGDADLTELIFAFGQAGQVNSSCFQWHRVNADCKSGSAIQRLYYRINCIRRCVTGSSLSS